MLSAAALATSAPEVKVPFERYVLPNGLRVILHVDRSSPLVAVNLWYHVGSKDEKAGRTGFAHLFEHLMFMGSKNAPYPSFDTLMEAWGGHNNGTTSTDRTNYYEIGPSNLLETFLWLEADRLATLPQVMTDDELGKQRKVVQNERRQSYENRPYGKAGLLIPENLYPADHPYHYPPIGSHADLEAARVDDVREFFARFYVPANASLVIAGDFDPDIARGLVDKYFAWQPVHPVPPRARPQTVALAADKRVETEDRVQLPRLYLAWHSPALFAAGDADMDLAARVLGGGKSSRFYRTLVFDKRIAQDVSAYQDSGMLGGRFGIIVTAKPGHTLDEIERVMDEELGKLQSAPFSAEEIDRARNKQLASFYKELDGLESRADMLNHYEHLLGDPGGVTRDLARYAAVTPLTALGALIDVVKGKRLVLRVVPEKAKAPPSKPVPAPGRGKR